MASPAAGGLWSLSKYCKEPEEIMLVGIWAGPLEFGGGEQRSQRRKSISWQDLVSKEGAVVDCLRQLPLELSVVLFLCSSLGDIPHVAVGKVPPSNRFGVLDRQDLSNGFLLQQQFPEDNVVLAISQNMTN